MTTSDSLGPTPLPTASPAAGPPPRILLVDDDLINQKVMVSLLKRKGWDALAAGSGRQCLECLTQGVFDLVLMDIQMPEMDGYQAAALVREQESQRAAQGLGARRVPIVALTTVSQPGTKERCLAAGMDDHLTKPVNTQALYTTIQRMLGLPS